MTESFEGFKKAAESFRVEHRDRRSWVGEHERVMLRHPLSFASRLAAGVVFALELHRQWMWEAQHAGDAKRLYTEVGLFAAFHGCLSRMADVLGEPQRDPFERLDPLFEGSIDVERARCVIRAYFGEVRRAPDLWLITVENLLDDPRVGGAEQERAAAALTGRVRAIAAYEILRGLQAGLDREGTDLLDELPMAVIKALKSRKPHEGLEKVRNKALSALRRDFKVSRGPRATLGGGDAGRQHRARTGRFRAPRRAETLDRRGGPFT